MNESNEALEVVKVKTRFIYAGHLLEVNLWGLGDGEVLSLGAIPQFDEDGKNLGIYPAQFAEGEAHEYLNENYDEKISLDTLEILVRETDEAIKRLIAKGVFGAVSK